MISDQDFVDANTSDGDDSSSEDSSLQTTVDGFDLSAIDELVRSNGFPLLAAQAAPLEWEHIPTNTLTSQQRALLLNQLRKTQKEITELTTIITSGRKNQREHLQRFHEQLNQKKLEVATLIEQLQLPTPIVRDILKPTCLVPLMLALYKIKSLSQRKQRYQQVPRPVDALGPREFDYLLNKMLLLIQLIINRDPTNSENYNIIFFHGENFPLIEVKGSDYSVAVRPIFLPHQQLQQKISLAHARSTERIRVRTQQQANLNPESNSLLAGAYALKAYVNGHQTNPDSPLKDIFAAGQVDGYICLEIIEFLTGVALSRKYKQIHGNNFNLIRTDTNSVLSAKTMLANMVRAPQIMSDVKLGEDYFSREQNTLKKIICLSESLHDLIDIVNGVLLLARHNIAITDLKLSNFKLRGLIPRLSDQKSVIGPFAKDLSEVKFRHVEIEFLTTEAYINEPQTLSQLNLQNLLSMLFVMLCNIDPPPQQVTRNLSGQSGADFPAVLDRLKQDFGNIADPAIMNVFRFFEQPGVLTGQAQLDSQTASTSTSSTATNSQAPVVKMVSAVTQLETLLKLLSKASTLLADYKVIDSSSENSSDSAEYRGATNSGIIPASSFSMKPK